MDVGKPLNCRSRANSRETGFGEVTLEATERIPIDSPVDPDDQQEQCGQ
jgi:hypothetical protein